MLAGSVFFAAPESAMVEIHIGDAFLRPEGNQATQAEVKIMEPMVLQVSGMHGTWSCLIGANFN